MKYFLAVALAALAGCSAPTAPVAHFHASHDQVGDACTTADGRSGWIISAGRDLVCSAT